MNTGFYVTAIDAGKSFLMLGPFDDKAAADAKVKAAVDKAYSIDARSWFMAWGTAKLDTPNDLPVGRLNKYMEA